MKMTVQRSDLKAAVTGLSKVVGAHTSLPVLASVRFSSNGAVTVEATDLDQTARYAFTDATAEGHGEFIIPLQAVKDLLTKGSGEDRIELEALPDSRVNVTNRIGSQSVCQTLTGLPPDEWPTGQVDVKTKAAAGFLESYRKAVPFASTDETRYVLNSVHIDVAGKGECPVTMVATDGRRLSCFNSMALPIRLPTIIPVTKFLSWPGLAGKVSIGIATVRDKVKGKLKGEERVTHFGLTAGPWHYVTKAIEGTYPDYRRVLPNPLDCPNRVVFTDADAAMLGKVLPGLAGKQRKDPIIVLSPGENGTVVVTEQKPPDETSTRLELSGGSQFEGKSPVAVNALFLCDALTAKFRRFMYQDECCPLLSEDSQGGKHVLMPMKLDATPKPAGDPVQEPTAEVKSEQVQEPATTAVGARETTPPSVEAAAVNQEKEAEMPENKDTKTGTENETTALDKVLAAYETAKQKVREANQALSEIADAVKLAVKEQRQQKAEVENVRAALGKLQSIRV